MCEKCNHGPSDFDDPLGLRDDPIVGVDFEAEFEAYQLLLENMDSLMKRQQELDERGQNFAGDLIAQFEQTHALSGNQWSWVGKLLDRIRNSEPVYGNFNAAFVMFRIAGESGLSKPRVRLVTKEDKFVLLTFHIDEKRLTVQVGGWAGHGTRRFAGWIHEDRIVPYNSEFMTEDVKNCLQDFALDPMQAAAAAVKKLGACTYCGLPLTDSESKRRGYGQVCAGNWGQPWGEKA